MSGTFALADDNETASVPGAPRPGGIASLAVAGPVKEDGPPDLAAMLHRAIDPARGNRLRQKLELWATLPNIAEEDDVRDDLSKIGQRVVMDYTIDETSRSQYVERYRRWLDFAMQITQNKVYPWTDASNIIYPLLTSAAVTFAARAAPAIIRDQNVVKGVVIGSDDGEPLLAANGSPIIGIDGQPAMASEPGEKQERADLIGRHMSWQLLFEQPDWEAETDRLLIMLPIVGCVFRKTRYDSSRRHNLSTLVTALDLCINYNAVSFERAPRQTELIRLYPWEIEERIRAGLFLDKEYGRDTMSTANNARAGGGERQDDQTDADAPTTFLEQHRRWDLDGDGYAEPYIITVARDSGILARIAVGFDPDEIQWAPSGRVLGIPKTEYYTRYSFIPSPESGVYDIGFGHLLFPINHAINTTLNQMFDAGHLQNTGGGFIGSGLSINGGSMRFQIGEYKQVNTLGGNIRDNVFPLPFPGPSQTLMALLSFLVDAGERLASIKDMLGGDMPADNTSGITTMAVIEQGLKVFSATYARIHRSLKSEFAKLFVLNRKFLPDGSGWNEGTVWHQIGRADYEMAGGVAPVSDPKMVTDMQRLSRAQFLMSIKDDPRVDGSAVLKDAIAAAGISVPENYMAKPQGPNPAVVLKEQELRMRSIRDMHGLKLKEARDQAAAIKDMAQAEALLADARMKDGSVDLQWAAQHLDRLKAFLDVAARMAEQSQPDTGARSGGGTTGDSAPDARIGGGAVLPVAAPSGNGAGFGPLLGGSA